MELKKYMQVEVYVELDGSALTIESPSVNYNVVQMALDATPQQYESLISATVSVGAGIQMDVVFYPLNASILSVTYSSSNTSVATINNNGYFVTKSIGTTTITATITSKQSNTNISSNSVITQKSFVLTTYVPIKEISLNSMQLELFEQNTLGYFDLDKSQFNLQLDINPSNATFNQDNIVWYSSSPYLSIEDEVVTASVPLDVIMPNNTINATITATIVEYGRYYAKTCLVTIKRAVKVDSITVYNAPNGYVYFDAREGAELVEPKQISVQTYPYNATNPNIRYVYVQDYQDLNPLPVFEVSEDGLITPKRAGIAKFHVVAEDSYISENSYARYNEIVVKVADGLTEETALELSTSADLVAINTENELALHYILSNNIDLTNTAFTPIGLIEGNIYEFTGSINGRFVYGSIDRQYKIKGLSLNNTSANLESYLGFVAVNSGVLKNLEIEVKNFNANATNNSDGSSSYFAGLTAVNNGLVESVSVNFVNTNVNIAAQNAFISIIAAQNNGDIINAVAYGDLTVKEAISANAAQIIFTGGITAQNNVDGVIEGSYVPANKLINEEDLVEPDYSNVLYQKEGMNSFAVIDTTQLVSEFNATGLAVGKNLGTISNIATDGEVIGLNNIGGLVGINVGVVQNSYSSSQVSGQYYVGGLIGFVMSETVELELIAPQIINNAVEIYDRQLSEEEAIINIQGTNFVGGLIGYVSDLDAFEYNYVNSYYLRTLGVNYTGDIIINLEDASQNYYVSGLVGFAENVIAELTKNYANATIAAIAPQTSVNAPVVYAGGLFGEIDGDFNLNNSYAKGEISLPATSSFAGGLVGHVINATASILHYSYSTVTLTAETTNIEVGIIEPLSVVDITDTDQALWDLTDSTIWYLDENINEGLPVLYNINDNLLINEAPESVIVIVRNQTVSLDTNTNKITFNHLKVSDNQAVVLLSKDEYLVSSLIQTTPLNSRYYLSTPNTDVIEILLNGKIRTLKEGTAIITVSSLLNTNISDTFELAVIKGFTSYSLSESQTAETGQLTSQNIIQIKLNESVILYSQLKNEDYSVTTNSGVIYKATADNFTVNGLDLNATLANVESHILTGQTSSDGNISVTVTPYITVSLGGENVQVEIEELKKSFYVSVYEGASSITSSLASATISLREELQLGLYITTDKSVEQIDISYGDVDGIEGDSIENYVSLELMNYENVAGDEYVYNYIIKAKPKFLEVNSGSGNFKSAKSGIITFVPNSNPYLATIFDITITPEDLLRIDMAHYPTGETQIDNYGKATYYPQELPSNIIAPGKPGILKVNLFPEYANVDYYEIVSSEPVAGQFISFEQVALTSSLYSTYYETVNPSPALIDFGTTLSLISTVDKTGESIVYDFDGNIYVKTLIATSVKKGTIFTVTITGYRFDEEGIPQVNLSKQIELRAEALPGVTLLYKGQSDGQVARGTRVPLELYLSEDYEGVIQDPIATFSNTDGKDYNALGTDITVDNVQVNYANIEKEGDTYYLSVGPGVPSGNTITVKAEVHRTINGILETSFSSITLQVVNFVIEDITVRETGLNNTMNLYVGGGFALEVNFKTEI